MGQNVESRAYAESMRPRGLLGLLTRTQDEE